MLYEIRKGTIINLAGIERIARRNPEIWKEGSDVRKREEEKAARHPWFMVCDGRGYDLDEATKNEIIKLIGVNDTKGGARG